MIAVTGANGFIGTNLVIALNRAGREDVVAVDRFDPPRYPDAVAVAERVDQDDFVSWLDSRAGDIEVIYHLGAFSSTSVTDREAVLANNVEYSKALWKWCVGQSVPFVYASSAGTYGDGSKGFDDEAAPSIYEPLSLYAESKQIFDLWALRQESTPPRWAGVKYFNVYGPYEAHKKQQASMGYHWFNQVRDTGEARLFKSYREGVADGEQWRDFIYVGDAVDATIHLLTAPAVANGLYNVGTGQARPFVDLARAVFAAMDKPPRLNFIDMPENLRGQYQYFTQAAVAKLRRSGFDRPFLTVEQGMQRYVEHRLAHEGVAS